ncbi:pyrroloquinoline quinone biosynthesis peptide chaperone PqqD [Veronia pacifica]|uniref:Pyrroloquinoline quinone biosynthesis protein PqqD n=1 Tax=Veronia pacifica TaxID=1080227 RepID=A0A1C3E807_9GAMM|nr:pyrroloquinoline quinone biosynthesis peptide chaperone PqqD [Veronia pacifica]ODA29363.1 pyrroloquinoline quinone biosynthesis protein PqqD [Veronia pacifica]
MQQEVHKFRLNPIYRMQFEKAQQCYVLLYPEGMVQLSESAAEILKQFESPRSLDDVISRLEGMFPGEELASDVREFVEVAFAKKWIEQH